MQLARLAAAVLMACSASVYAQTPAIGPTLNASATVTGETRYEVTGLENPDKIGSSIVAGVNSKPALAPFGFVAYTGTANEVEVRAENAKRERVDVVEFGDGWKVDGAGKVWVDVRAVWKSTVDINGTPTSIVLDIKDYTVSFTIEGTTPQPDPDPDDPPEPGTSPFPGSGLQVLIVHERTNLQQLPAAQRAIILGAEMRAWLRENCVEIDGTAAFRVLDKDTESTGDIGQTGQVWLDVLDRPRDSLPWLAVGNGSAGYEGPLPATIAETQTLLEGYK